MEIPSHLQRVSGYCALLAEPLGLDAELIRVASRLHDVGMAAVAGRDRAQARAADARANAASSQDHTELGHAMLDGLRASSCSTPRREIALHAPRALRRRRLPARAAPATRSRWRDGSRPSPTRSTR